MAAYVPMSGWCGGVEMSVARWLRAATRIYWPAIVAVVALATTLVAYGFAHRSVAAIVVLPASAEQPADPELALSGPTVARRADFVSVTGEVRNLTKEAMTNVEALAEFFDADGHLVKVESALVELPTVRPGEESPFSVETRDAPGISSCRIRFRHLMGPSVPTSDR